MLKTLLVPLAAFIGFLGVAIGGRVGQALVIVGCVLAGAAVVLLLIGG